MMIEVVRSTSSINSSSVKDTVEAALDAIVKHYRDPIHAVQEESLPYFDVAETPPDVPPVIQHWIDRLADTTYTQRAIDSCVTTNSIYYWEGTAACLINGYSQWIRPTLFRRHQHASNTITLAITGIPVLQHYELLLSQILLKSKTRKDPGENSIKIDGKASMEGGDEPRIAVKFRPLEEMASDISLLTKLAIKRKMNETDNETIDDEEPSLHMVANMVLPTMIRLLTHCIDIVCTMRILGIAKCDDDAVLKKALQKCAVVLLAFGHPRMDPRHVTAALETRLMVVQDDPTFLYALQLQHHPRQQQQEDEQYTQEEGSLLDLGSHVTEESFWAQLRLDGSAWEDPETGVVSRAVDTFWRHLFDYTSILRTGKALDPPLIDSHNRQSMTRIVKACLDSLSDENSGDLPKAVRAHFFGRDVIRLPAEDRLVSSIVSATTTRLHLGRTITVQEEDPTKAMNKAFLDTPSRVHAALHYILLLQHEDILLESNKSDENPVLEEMLPVIYELLSADEKAHVALGSTALIHLLSLTLSPQQPGWKANATSNTGRDLVACGGVPFAKYYGSLLPVLNLACRTCRDGAPLLLLGRAQSMVCHTASLVRHNLDDDTLAKHRRMTTSYFLSILDKHSHQVSDPDDLLWSLLIGGIIPLLHQHATVKESVGNVDALEMGRLGLTALLPILRYSSGWSLDENDESKSTASATTASNYNSTRKLLAPSVLALVYLLQVAYPIMPRHGGKIMSEVLALLGNLQRQSLSTAEDLALVNLVKDAAGVVLVICGERAAQVLELVTSSSKIQHKGDFEPGLSGLAEDIGARAGKWRKVQQQASGPTPVAPTVVLLE